MSLKLSEYVGQWDLDSAYRPRANRPYLPTTVFESCLNPVDRNLEIADEASDPFDAVGRLSLQRA